ncbi:MAG: response regulator, partial [Rhodospirillaceae bacterium]|nr:response regulator [Rhodospirillaceae bacterium]
MADAEENGLTIADDASLLIVDDEINLRLQLAKAMDRRGFQTDVAESVAEGIRAVEARPPKYAVIDLRLDDGSGLDVVETLRRVRPDARIVVLTGYGN